MLCTKEAWFLKIYLKVIENEKIIFVGVDFSGIQGFIYQNYSMESLNEITRRSDYIQNLQLKLMKNYKILEEYFYTPITVSSGKIQAIIKNNKNAGSIFENHLKKIQETVFLENQGKIQIFYGATHALIQNRSSGRYKSAFSVLMNVIERNKYQSSNLYELDSEYSGHSGYSICSLTPERESENFISLDSIKLAAVKMDFDNLGNLFSNIMEADIKEDISEKIIEIIDKAVTGINSLHLIYAGGDDIFFICPFDCILEVIQTIYLNIKRRVYEEQALASYQNDFGISCGICLFHRYVPMIYYLTMQRLNFKIKEQGKKFNNCGKPFLLDEWQQLNEIMNR